MSHVTVSDPHHEQRAEWKYDGKTLRHREGTGKWVTVRRISFTPKRIQLIAKLIYDWEYIHGPPRE